ncbi:glutathione S-transferase family protein [Thalassococcus sp. S3]|uniref:glutathione S-transferase family protein n=1 Tax=Thalassococcus sp. S3 TaxID=2017482 RepID=UPI001C2C304A|nr:glutathione S-transferase family protein [Thalassococcus sp. S3]
MLTVYGLRYSVYTRIVRLLLEIRQAHYSLVEANPFSDPPDPDLDAISPFRRIPVLDHDGFRLYETAAITRYLATVLPGDALVPAEARLSARMDQVIHVIDSYGYWPLVRQVFSHSVFRPHMGLASDPDEVRAGLSAAAPVLAELEAFSTSGAVLSENNVTLADLHLAPMLGYFTMAPEGAAMVERHPALSRWWSIWSAHPAYLATDPGLETLAAER